MKCSESIDIMLNVIYGEEVDPEKAYGFFCHLKECASCDAEFRELSETRVMLRDWDTAEEEGSSSEVSAGSYLPRRGFNWWGTMQKIAATLLIITGAVAAGQAVGFIPEKQVEIPEVQLTRMIHDIVVERQSEGWVVIGKALVSLKEDMDSRDQMQTEVFYEDLTEMEMRFLSVMEENQLQSRELTSQ